MGDEEYIVDEMGEGYEDEVGAEDMGEEGHNELEVSSISLINRHLVALRSCDSGHDRGSDAADQLLHTRVGSGRWALKTRSRPSSSIPQPCCNPEK